MSTTQERIDILLRFEASNKALLESKAALDQLKGSIAGVTSLGSNILGGLGLGIGISAVISQFKSFTDQAAALSSEIERNRSRIGLSAEAYQVYSSVLKSAGQEVAAINPAFDRLADVIGNAGRGAADAVKSLDAIGLKFRDLRGLSAEAQFDRVAQALASIKDENLRAAAGVDVLGKSYSQLKPLIEALATKGMPQLRDEVRLTSGLMSNEMSKALDEVATRSEAAGTKIANAFAGKALYIRELIASSKELFAGIVSQPEAQPRRTVARFTDIRTRAANVSSPEELEQLKAEAKAEQEIAVALEANYRKRGNFNQEEMARYSQLTTLYTELLTSLNLHGAETVRINALEKTQKENAEALSGVYADVAARRSAAAADLGKSTKAASDLAFNSLKDQDKLVSLQQQLEALNNRRATTEAEFLVGATTLAQKEEARKAALTESLKIETERLRIQSQIRDLSEKISADTAAKKKSADADAAEKSREALSARSQQRQQQDIDLGGQLAAKQLEISRIEQNRLLTTTQKQAKIAPLLQQENELIAQRIALLQQQAQLETDSGARLQIGKNIEQLQQKQGQVTLQQEQIQPVGIGDGIQQGAVDYVNSVGTAGEQVAQVINGTIGGAVASVSDGLSDWVLGAQSFGDAMQQVGAEILSTVVHEFINAMVAGFARMVVQWIITKSAMFAVDVAFAAKGLALSIATAAKSLVSWIPSAIAASISSYGLAAGIGAAAVAAILVARNNFAEGGLVTGPGTGTSDSIPANLSNGEYVLPAAVVQRIGLANVRAMHYGRAYADGGLVSVPGAAAPTAVQSSPSIIVNFGEEAVRDHVFGHSDFDAHVIRVLNDRGYRAA